MSAWRFIVSITNGRNAAPADGREVVRALRGIARTVAANEAAKGEIRAKDGRRIGRWAWEARTR